MIETGSSHEEMTNELKDFGPNAYIDEFVSGGPKNYGYKVMGTSDGHPAYCIKVRGISLNNSTATKVNFKTLKRLVHQFVKEKETEEVSVVTSRIDVNRRDRQLVRRSTEKKYRVVYDKRIVLDDFTTLPYGYCDL